MYGASFNLFIGFQWRQLREIGGQVTELKAERRRWPPRSRRSRRRRERSSPPPTASAPPSWRRRSTRCRRRAGAGGRQPPRQALPGGLGAARAGHLVRDRGPRQHLMRANKLFPGPHLYAGAGVVVSWAMAASLVPLMAKGKESARIAHTTLKCSRSASSRGRYRRAGRSRRRSSRTPSSVVIWPGPIAQRVCVSRVLKAAFSPSRRCVQWPSATSLTEKFYKTCARPHLDHYVCSASASSRAGSSRR